MFLKNLIIFLRVRKSLTIKDLRARPRPGRKSLARNDLRLGDHEVALGVLGELRVGLATQLIRNHLRVLRGDGLGLPKGALRPKLGPLLLCEIIISLINHFYMCTGNSGFSHTSSQLYGELDRSHGATLHLTLDLESRAKVMAFSRPSWLGANQRTNSSRPVSDLTSTKYLAFTLITKTV